MEQKSERLKKKQFSRRAFVIGGLYAGGFAALTARLYYLQNIKAEEFTTKAEGNRIRLIPSVPDRGHIVDRNGKVLAEGGGEYQLFFKKKHSLSEEELRNVGYIFSEILAYSPLEEEELIDVKKFINQVLPKKVIREYVLTLMSTFLSGKTSNEKFHIWTGSGGNGKSKLIELFEYCFGDYCCKLPVTLLTQQRARAEGANPVLVRTKGKRFAVLQEPEKDEVINVGLMKELTGGDKIIARALHKDPIEFKPQFKLVMTCNKLIKPSSNDDGVWRRMSVVDFPSRFVESPNPKSKFEFKIDENLNEKLKIWPEAFIYVLLNEYFVKFKLNGIREPTEVKKNNAEFKADSDVFALFISEKIEEDCTNDKGTKIDDIYFVYQEWFQQSYGHIKNMESKKEFKKSLIKKYGANINKNSWVGIKIKDINLDMEFED